MSCCNCGEQATIKAHLVPKCFVNEVKGIDGKVAVTNRSNDRYRPTQSGLFDHNILCAGCDQLLGKFDNAAFQILKQGREICRERPVNQIAELEGDSNDLLRFVAGLLYRFAVTRNQDHQVQLGKYTTQMKKMAFQKSDCSQVSLLIFRPNTEAEVFFYRQPTQKRLQGEIVVEFFVGGFLICAKYNSRPYPGAFKALETKHSSSIKALICEPEQMDVWRDFETARSSKVIKNFFGEL